MERTKQSLTSQPSSGGTPSGDLHRLKENSSASIAELRDFLGQMRGKRPDEVLGAVAESSLVQSLCLATVGFAGLLVVFTILPYALRDSSEAAADSNVQATVATENSDQPAGQETASSATDTAPASDNGSATSTSPEEVAERLGIGETREADPSSNPLDNNLDSLLDGLD